MVKGTIAISVGGSDVTREVGLEHEAPLPNLRIGSIRRTFYRKYHDRASMMVESDAQMQERVQGLVNEELVRQHTHTHTHRHTDTPTHTRSTLRARARVHVHAHAAIACASVGAGEAGLAAGRRALPSRATGAAPRARQRHQRRGQPQQQNQLTATSIPPPAASTAGRSQADDDDGE